MIDIELLEKGQDYSELKNSIIIFICTFDEFGGGRHLYTFENRNEDLTQDLDDAVREVRKDKRWRNKLMTVEEYANATAKQAAKNATEATIKRLNDLNQKLLADNRIEDLKKSIEDRDFQHQLMMEYGIVDENN